MKLLSKKVIFLLGGGLFSVCAYSADCYHKKSSEKEVIFEGSVKAIRHVLEDGIPISNNVFFEVKQWLEGKDGDEVVVSTDLFSDPNSFGYPFFCGNLYRVHAVKRDTGLLYVDRCMQIESLSHSSMEPDDLEYFLFGDSGVSESERQVVLRQMVCP